MIVAAVGVMDILQAALTGVVILLLLRSITIQESYGAINWSVIIMIAAFIPVGIAMEESGTAAWWAMSLPEHVTCSLRNWLPMRFCPSRIWSQCS